MPINVIIADDHEIFRAGLKYSLQQHTDVEVIGEAANGEELLDMLHFKTPDIILLDLNMPKMDGFKTLQKIAANNKKLKVPIKVIIVSAHDSESYIMETIEEGACGFLSKNSKSDEIAMAIDSCKDNGIYFNDKTNKALLSRLVKRKKLHPVFDQANIALTPTEVGVLKLLCREMKSAEIAKELFMSSRSVEDVRYQLLKKTSTKNAVGLALWAAKNDIISY